MTVFNIGLGYVCHPENKNYCQRATASPACAHCCSRRRSVSRGVRRTFGRCRVEFSADGRHLWLNNNRYVTRHRVVVDQRIEDPAELLRRAEAAIGMRLHGLQLEAIEPTPK